MTKPDNADRAHWAREAVQAYRSVCRGSPLDDLDGWDEAIGDLFGDMLHLAAKEGLDPLEVVRRAVCFYLDERDYLPDGWAPSNALARCSIETWRE